MRRLPIKDTMRLLLHALTSYYQDDMDFVGFKLVLLVCSWLVAKGSPVAMLQHATSSQSIVFHPQTAAGTSSTAGSGATDQYGSTPPKYEYKYEVMDHQTGDRKSHWESRDGDRVRGAYTLYEPDGALRTVEYTADSLHGFNAVVRRDEPKRTGLNAYNPASNSVQEGYDSPTPSRYSPLKSTFPSGQGNVQAPSGSSGYSQGYQVDHGYGPRVEPVKPY